MAPKTSITQPGIGLPQNIGMANALKFKGYDYHFSFGVGQHNNAQGAAEQALRPECRRLRRRVGQ
jgi:hypothetical protein